MTDTYVIRGRKQAWDKPSQYIYDVYADTADGFADFCIDHVDDVSPASTAEIADLKATLRLRMDGSWETTGETEDGTDPAQVAEDAAVASFLDELVSDEDLAEYMESETS